MLYRPRSVEPSPLLLLLSSSLFLFFSSSPLSPSDLWTQLLPRGRLNSNTGRQQQRSMPAKTSQDRHGTESSPSSASCWRGRLLAPGTTPDLTFIRTQNRQYLITIWLVSFVLFRLDFVRSFTVGPRSFVDIDDSSGIHSSSSAVCLNGHIIFSYIIRTDACKELTYLSTPHLNPADHSCSSTGLLLIPSPGFGYCVVIYMTHTCFSRSRSSAYLK